MAAVDDPIGTGLVKSLARPGGNFKELGGWKSLAMVARYAHLSPSHRRDAIERLAARRPAPEKARSAGAE